MGRTGWVENTTWVGGTWSTSPHPPQAKPISPIGHLKDILILNIYYIYILYIYIINIYIYIYIYIYNIFVVYLHAHCQLNPAGRAGACVASAGFQVL